mmetsp:Transcript_47925/g.134927  ORF Transcript_47925/g.134927 Transcript_47925/m.134927 type:complete len:398 (+) Transcript_47925:110-1303(+)
MSNRRRKVARPSSNHRGGTATKPVQVAGRIAETSDALRPTPTAVEGDCDVQQLRRDALHDSGVEAAEILRCAVAHPHPIPPNAVRQAQPYGGERRRPQELLRQQAVPCVEELRDRAHDAQPDSPRLRACSLQQQPGPGHPACGSPGADLDDPGARLLLGRHRQELVDVHGHLHRGREAVAQQAAQRLVAQGLRGAELLEQGERAVAGHEAAPSLLDGEDPGEQPEPSGAGALELGDEPLLDDVQGVPRPRLRRELPSHGQLDDALQVYAPDLRRQRVQRLRGHVIDDDPLAARAQLDDAQHVSDRNLVINEREHLTKQVQYQQVHGEVPDTAVRALDDEQRQAREAPGRPGVRGRPRGESEDDAHEVEYVPRPCVLPEHVVRRRVLPIVNKRLLGLR